MDGSTIGLIGGIAGSLIGVVGGTIGTYFSIKSTKGPLEKSIMVKLAIVVWVLISVFLILLFVAPIQYKTILWVVYGASLPLVIILGNKKLRQIRKQEGNA